MQDENSLFYYNKGILDSNKKQRIINRLMELNIRNKIGNDIEDLPFELVERKGVGHPDTICDAIAETASRYYSLYFFEKYGRIANHWFDKVMLIGGESDKCPLQRMHPKEHLEVYLRVNHFLKLQKK